MYVEVLRVVDIAIRPIDNSIDHSRLEIQHDRARHVARVVGLVKEDIFAVAAGVRALGGVGVEVAVLVYAVLKAELLPELRADWEVLVLVLGSYDVGAVRVGGVVDVPLLPHWPAWTVMISLCSCQYSVYSFQRDTRVYRGILPCCAGHASSRSRKSDGWCWEDAL